MTTNPNRRHAAFITAWAILAAMTINTHASEPAQPPTNQPPQPAPPQWVQDIAREAARKGQPFEVIPPTVSQATGAAAGPSSQTTGDGNKNAVNGTPPEINLGGTPGSMPGSIIPGPSGKGGNVKASNSSNAFEPFNPSGSNIAGWFFILLGIGIYIASAYLPKLPKTAGTASIATGLVLLIAPTWLHDNEWVGYIVIGAGAIIAIGFIGYKAKWFEHAIGPATQAKLINDGDPAGAGALAHLQMTAPGAKPAVVAAASRIVKSASDYLDEVEAALAPKDPAGRSA